MIASERSCRVPRRRTGRADHHMPFMMWLLIWMEVRDTGVDYAQVGIMDAG